MFFREQALGTPDWLYIPIVLSACPDMSFEWTRVIDQGHGVPSPLCTRFGIFRPRVWSYALPSPAFSRKQATPYNHDVQVHRSSSDRYWKETTETSRTSF